MSQLNIPINEPVSSFVQTPAVIDEKGSVQEAAKMMKSSSTGSILVTKEGEPLGILTEWDILTRVVSEGKSVRDTKVGEVMSSPLEFIQSDAKVGEAISLMIKKGFRRLAVKKESKLLGIISLTQVVGNKRENVSTLPMIEPARGVQCPYCGSLLKNGEELSRHIDQVHIREELLHGIRGKW